MSGAFGSGRGPAGAAGSAGATGNPGVSVLSAPFTQPAALSTVNARFESGYLTPEVGMLIAGAAGLYEVDADLGGGMFTLTCLEIRGTPQGGTVAIGARFGQAGVQ